MSSNHDARLSKLEKATTAQDRGFQTQIVFYDPATGQPLTPPDARRYQIWFGVTDADEQAQILRR